VSTSNGANYGNYVSFGIRGELVSYTGHIVIFRYKSSKTIIIQVPNEGYLNYKLTGWEINNTDEIIVNISNILNNKIDYTSNILFENPNNKIEISKVEMALLLDVQILNTSNHVLKTSNFLNNKINTTFDLLNNKINQAYNFICIAEEVQNNLAFNLTNFVNEKTNNIKIAQLKPPILPSNT